MLIIGCLINCGQGPKMWSPNMDGGETLVSFLQIFRTVYSVIISYILKYSLIKKSQLVCKNLLLCHFMSILGARQNK